MDEDRIDGAATQARGSVKEAISKVTGEKTTQAEGTAEKTAGKVEGEAGKAKDAVRDAGKK